MTLRENLELFHASIMNECHANRLKHLNKSDDINTKKSTDQMTSSNDMVAPMIHRARDNNNNGGALLLLDNNNSNNNNENNNRSNHNPNHNHNNGVHMHMNTNNNNIDHANDIDRMERLSTNLRAYIADALCDNTTLALSENEHTLDFMIDRILELIALHMSHEHEQTIRQLLCELQKSQSTNTQHATELQRRAQALSALRSENKDENRTNNELNEYILKLHASLNDSYLKMNELSNAMTALQCEHKNANSMNISYDQQIIKLKNALLSNEQQLSVAHRRTQELQSKLTVSTNAIQLRLNAEIGKNQHLIENDMAQLKTELKTERTQNEQCLKEIANLKNAGEVNANHLSDKELQMKHMHEQIQKHVDEEQEQKNINKYKVTQQTTNNKKQRKKYEQHYKQVMELNAMQMRSEYLLNMSQMKSNYQKKYEILKIKHDNAMANKNLEFENAYKERLVQHQLEREQANENEKKGDLQSIRDRNQNKKNEDTICELNDKIADLSLSLKTVTLHAHKLDEDASKQKAKEKEQQQQQCEKSVKSEQSAAQYKQLWENEKRMRAEKVREMADEHRSKELQMKTEFKDSVDALQIELDTNQKLLLLTRKTNKNNHKSNERTLNGIQNGNESKIRKEYEQQFENELQKLKSEFSEQQSSMVNMNQQNKKINEEQQKQKTRMIMSSLQLQITEYEIEIATNYKPQIVRLKNEAKNEKSKLKSVMGKHRILLKRNKANVDLRYAMKENYFVLNEKIKNEKIHLRYLSSFIAMKFKGIHLEFENVGQRIITFVKHRIEHEYQANIQQLSEYQKYRISSLQNRVKSVEQNNIRMLDIHEPPRRDGNDANVNVSVHTSVNDKTLTEIDVDDLCMQVNDIKRELADAKHVLSPHAYTKARSCRSNTSHASTTNTEKNSRVRNLRNDLDSLENTYVKRQPLTEY